MPPGRPSKQVRSPSKAEEHGAPRSSNPPGSRCATIPDFHAQFERLAACKGAGKAIVAIARKLLVAIWHVLTKQVADGHADPIRVARKLWHWAQKHRTASRLGMPRLAFVRTYLDRLQVGQDLTTLEAGRTTYMLPPTR